VSVNAIFRQLTVLPCASPLGDQRASMCDPYHRRDELICAYIAKSRLSEEQFTPVGDKALPEANDPNSSLG
jgi:hypothetical protein